jgi:hypothetical protein
MKILLFTYLSFALTITCADAQQGSGFQKEYIALKSNSPIVDKNFYLLTAIEKSTLISKLMSSEPFLKTLLSRKVEIIKSHITDTCTSPISLLKDFKIGQSESLQLDSIQRLLYKLNAAAFDDLVNKHLRPSGYYQRFINETNLDLLRHQLHH